MGEGSRPGRRGGGEGTEGAKAELGAVVERRRERRERGPTMESERRERFGVQICRVQKEKEIGRAWV